MVSILQCCMVVHMRQGEDGAAWGLVEVGWYGKTSLVSRLYNFQLLDENENLVRGWVADRAISKY